MQLKDRFMNVKDMLEAQDSLNKIINPQWRNIGNKNAHSPYMHQVQILEESIEMIGSGVKHQWWKKVDTSNFDMFNFKIELIDMLHFYLSQYILLKVEGEGNKLEFDGLGFEDMYFGCDVADIGNEQFDLSNFATLLKNTNELNHEEFMIAVREIVSLDKFAAQVDGKQLSRIFYGAFNYLVTLARLEGQELSALFVAKMELNRFRQSEGYKSGKYVKVRDGMEDNERLQPIVEEFLENKELTLGWVRKNVRDVFFKLTQ